MFNKDMYARLLRNSLEGKSAADIEIIDENRQNLLENPKDLEVAIQLVKDNKNENSSQFNPSNILHNE